MRSGDPHTLVVHALFGFDTGGHGNGVVNPINMEDLDSSRPRYHWIEGLCSPFVHRWVAHSKGLQAYLTQRAGIAPQRVTQIYNGVDTECFAPAQGQGIQGDDGLRARPPVTGGPLRELRHWLMGNVGRKQTVKDQTLPARAFMRARAPALLARLRLVLVGGNAELVDAATTGELVPPGDVGDMAQALLEVTTDPARLGRMGRAGLARVEQHFSLQAMIGAYQDLYARLLCRS